MTGLNLTIKETDTINYLQTPYTPTTECFDWCSTQHIVHSNNISVYSVLIIAIVYLLLVGKEFMLEHDQLKNYAGSVDQLSRTLLVVFFVYYFLVVRWGII